MNRNSKTGCRKAVRVRVPLSAPPNFYARTGLAALGMLVTPGIRWARLRRTPKLTPELHSRAPEGRARLSRGASGQGADKMPPSRARRVQAEDQSARSSQTGARCPWLDQLSCGPHSLPQVQYSRPATHAFHLTDLPARGSSQLDRRFRAGELPNPGLRQPISSSPYAV